MGGNTLMLFVSNDPPGAGAERMIITHLVEVERVLVKGAGALRESVEGLCVGGGILGGNGRAELKRSSG